MSKFENLNLLPSLINTIEKAGYTEPTPIQKQSIPIILEGKDLLGIAQTGTGKTAAFCLPILNHLETQKQKPLRGKSRILILTPTRELATQIGESIKNYSKGIKLSTKVIFGGVGHRPQVEAIAKGLDIIVATPGRLLEHLNDGVVHFDKLDILVLDEADRMLDMGFIRDIRKILEQLPKQKQTLLFSATMPKDIISLARQFLKNPVEVEVTPQSTTVEKISQFVNKVQKPQKPNLLKAILKDKAIKRALVFTRTKHGANRVVKHLDQGNIKSAAIHGNKSQRARETALENFKKGNIKVLVATDIAARGIDVDHVGHVINYDLPNEAESYVHRIGRTARAGRDGIAISFCDETELKQLRSIEKLIKMKVPLGKEYELDSWSTQPKKRPTKQPHSKKKKTRSSFRRSR